MPALPPAKKNALLLITRQNIHSEVEDIQTEYCFNVETTAPLSEEETVILRWLLSETFEPDNFSDRSFFGSHPPASYPAEKGISGPVVEVGPRLNFMTAWSTNAVSVCHACGLRKIIRIERSRRYKLILRERVQGFEGPRGQVDKSFLLESSNPKILESFLSLIHDRMTECPYPDMLTSFETGMKPEPVSVVPLIENGRDALQKMNAEMGLGLDEWDIDYYYNLFVREIGRNPTNVECFDLGQSNSEHSRHWFFKGRLVIDGTEIPHTLMDIIMLPLRTNPRNSVVAFKDNSSAIRGYPVQTIVPEIPGVSCRFRKKDLLYHITFTAETHNFPTGVAPFPGAETGTGGRIRDVHATGRGSLVVAGTAAYCVGNLHIPGYALPWEETSFVYPQNLATPLQIEIEASNGASDYGNKFGEPVIQGFTRSFGVRLPGGERREWLKPIMFAGGVGQMDDRHVEKGMPEKGMKVVKIGGPAFRIGIGGGAASSMIQGENIAELDFSAVQRGDAEMEQKVNRVIRACVEMGDGNPIISIHDQGAGGNCNVVKEIIYPAGALIEIRNIQLGDHTLSVLEIWGAEYQEQDALLLRSDRIDEFLAFCRREKVPCAVIGNITGDGFIVIHDATDGTTPVNLELSKVLGKMPQKTFRLERIPPEREPLQLPEDITPMEALGRVLRLVSVGSKRFLTNKVDRSVTGLIARQQCAGPLQLTISDVAVVSQSHFGLTGAAISIGEQPIKGLIDPAAMARMSVGEAITNIVWAKVTALEDIKCSGNWMWAAKLPGEGARLYDAALALRDILLELGIAIDGGKDSLSMAAKVMDASGLAEVVKAPGNLVISAYVTCPDITKVVSPDIKKPGASRLLYIDLGCGRYRTGGSALAHAYKQVGNESPDVDDPRLLKRAFNVLQHLISDGLVLAGHDRSDGGLIVTLLEMAFGGNCGIDIQFHPPSSPSREVHAGDPNLLFSLLFAEELGFVIEYLPEHEQPITDQLKQNDIPFQIIGKTITGKEVIMAVHDRQILRENMNELRAIWEETSYQIERLQANPECADEEKKTGYDRSGPAYKLTFTPTPSGGEDKSAGDVFHRSELPKVAILREEGSNGDREMAAAFYRAGFDVWDITMTDLLDGAATLDGFRGLAFVGGFSYADVLDSAKGWAGVIRFNENLYEQFQRFSERPDTFSFGVCNGCQLMALLGWIPWKGIPDYLQPRFIQNRSGRFESRFSTVSILRSPAIMLQGMEGSTLGVWVAHGEGRLIFPDRDVMEEVVREGLAPIRFVDDDSEFTEVYPFNPNGSPAGITALCSSDGRHLAMMPHPERTFLKWQWAYMPEDWKQKLKESPWLRMFQNAREWCG
jgi:phosphoribosylformylglycinamidine synthase